MKNLYHKVIDDKGRVLIPHDLREMADLQDYDIVRLCVHNKIVIMEKVNIPPVDMVAKLRQSFDKPNKPMPEDAVECFVLAALAKMDKTKQAEIMAQLSELNSRQ